MCVYVWTSYRLCIYCMSAIIILHPLIADTVKCVQVNFLWDNEVYLICHCTKLYPLPTNTQTIFYKRGKVNTEYCHQQHIIIIVVVIIINNLKNPVSLDFPSVALEKIIHNSIRSYHNKCWHKTYFALNGISHRNNT